MKLLINLFLSCLAIAMAAYIIPGVHLEGVWAALVVAVVLGIVNTFIKPIVVVLTLPISLVTLGLFALVINAFLILLVDFLVKGFSVSGFWAALLFSFVVSILKMFFNRFDHE